jgi:hypothetical protein
MIIFLISHRSTHQEMNTLSSKLHCHPYITLQTLTQYQPSVIAVSDLGAHAFESWTSHDTGKMWLKDFLPDDVKSIRIMSYGYSFSKYDETIDINTLDHRRNLLQTLANARRSTPVCILDSVPFFSPSILA